MTYEDAQKLKEDATVLGVHAKYKEREIYKWVLDIIKIIRPVLDKLENSYLDELESLLSFGFVPRDIFERIYKEDPKKAVYVFSVIVGTAQDLFLG